jgi:hypothetical protein
MKRHILAFQPHVITFDQVKDYRIVHQLAVSSGIDEHKVLQAVVTVNGTRFQVLDRRKVKLDTPWLWEAVEEYNNL